jgi:hypothetical protein
MKLLIEDEKFRAGESSVFVEVRGGAIAKAGVDCVIGDGVQLVVDEGEARRRRCQIREGGVDSTEFDEAEVIHHFSTLVMCWQLQPCALALVQ